VAVSKDGLQYRCAIPGRWFVVPAAVGPMPLLTISPTGVAEIFLALSFIASVMPSLPNISVET
jgi:hypothetical protein